MNEKNFKNNKFKIGKMEICRGCANSFRNRNKSFGSAGFNRNNFSHFYKKIR